MGACLQRVARTWNRWVDWLNAPERPEALALLRITFGLALLANVTQQLVSGQALEMYAEIGHGGVFGFRYNNSPYTLFRIIPLTAAGVYGLLGAQWVASACLALGLYTRAAAVVAWAIQVTLMDRMVLYRYDGDNVFRVVLFLVAMAPMGAAWSLDAVWRGKGMRTVPRWARGIFMLQLAIIYSRTGLVKLGSTWSFMEDWSALYLALNLPHISRWPGDWAAHPLVYPLTQVGTFVAGWWETLFFLLPVSMHLRRGAASRRHVPRNRAWRVVRRWLVRFDLRPAFLGIGIAMHASLIVLVSVGLFSIVMMSVYPAYLFPHEVRGMARALRRRVAAWRGQQPGSTAALP